MHRLRILRFIALAWGFTWIVMLPLLLARRGVVDWPVPAALEVVAAFGPFVAALLMARHEGPAAWHACMARLRGGRVTRRWAMVTVLSPVAFLLVALALIAAGGALPGPPLTVMWAALGAEGLVHLVIVSSLLQAAGEEPGWRGWLLPTLRTRHGPGVATLLLFPAWLLWHLPFFLARPEFGMAQFAGFSLGILSAAVWLTWLWEATRSVVVAIAWHALINVARGLALAVSVPVFLAYGGVVAVGALAIALTWMVRRPPAQEQ